MKEERVPEDCQEVCVVLIFEGKGERSVHGS